MEEQNDYIELEELKKEKPKPKSKGMFEGLHEEIIEGYKGFEKGISIMQDKAQDYLYGMHPSMKKDKDEKGKTKKEFDPLGLMEWEGG